MDDEDNVVPIKSNKKSKQINKYGPKFKPEFHEMLLEHMAQGLSYEIFAAKIGTHRSTLYLWERTNAAWHDTKCRAKELCQLYWEKQGLNLVSNPAVWMFQMKARFGWRDTVSVEQTVSISNEEKERSVEEIKSRYNEIVNERARAIAIRSKDNLPE